MNEKKHWKIEVKYFVIFEVLHFYSLLIGPYSLLPHLFL